jgi:hypothetical protein
MLHTRQSLTAQMFNRRMTSKLGHEYKPRVTSRRRVAFWMLL